MLRDSDFRAFFDSHLAVRFVLEAHDGSVVAANQAACNFYGFSEEELQQRCFDDFSAPEDCSIPFLLKLQSASTAGVARLEMVHVLKNGEIRDVGVYVERIERSGKSQLFVILHDITALVQTRRQLNELRTRYELASRGANDGIWDWNIVSSTNFWSDRCKELLGYEPHEIDATAETVFDYIHPDDIDRVRSLLHSHLQGDCAYDLEYRLRCKNGAYHWFHVRGQAVWDADGKPLRMAGSIRDVTERIASEKRLRESEQRFAYAISGTQQGIWDWNPVTGDYYWSPLFKSLLGYQDDELAARQGYLYETMHPEDVIRVRNAAAAHLAGKAPYDIRYRLKVRSGEYRWFWARGQAVFDEHGKAIRVSGSLTDVHKEVEAEAEEALRTKRVSQQHQAMLELATDSRLCDEGFRAACARILEISSQVLDVGRCAVLLFEDDGNILRTVDLFVVAKSQHFSGNKSKADEFSDYFQQLQESRVIDVFDPYHDPRTRAFPEAFLEERCIKSMLDVPVRRGGEVIGSVRFSEVRAQRQWQEDEINFAVEIAQQVVRAFDIVEAADLEQHQLELEKRVLQAQKLESLGVMAGGIAHDFNNLLVVIMGNADLVGGMLPRDTEERRLVAEIENASRRAAELCHQMLAYSGHTTFQLKRFDLSALVEEMTNLLRASIAPNVVTEYCCAANLPQIEGDPTQVRQIIMNLIVNASEAVESQGGGQVTIRTGVCPYGPGMSKNGLDVPVAADYVFLEVEDNGCGMTQDVLERIFDPFFSTKFTGRGLGLASMLGIMRSCLGGISITSAPELGATFRALFPIARGEAQEQSLLSSRSCASSWTGHGKALLVDDDQTVLMLGAEMLKRLGFEVLPASDGQEAIALYRQHHQALRLVVLDLTMPSMDGEETLRHLQAINPTVPVVMSSGYSEQDVALRVNADDFAAFMQKPYTLDQLQLVLAKVLG